MGEERKEEKRKEGREWRGEGRGKLPNLQVHQELASLGGVSAVFSIPLLIFAH